MYKLSFRNHFVDVHSASARVDYGKDEPSVALKKNRSSFQNVLQVSAMLTLFSLLITWVIEIVANEILLRY